MWMLLRVPARPEPRSAENPAEPGREVLPAATLNGHVSRLPSFLLEGDPAGQFKVFIHPGRSGLGEISAEQARQQLDWARATLHPTIGQAELAAEGYAGFLVEVFGAFKDGEGRCHQSGVFFVPLLRLELSTKD